MVITNKLVNQIPKTGSLSESQLKEVFLKHDKDGDKCLSQQEIKQAFKELRASLPGRRATKALQFADANGDGVITNDEIDLLVRYAQRQFGE